MFAARALSGRSMTKRAAIYVRVSNERRQADKASPKMQEAECREYCTANGWQVVAAYRDIKKYRVGKRLVDPSGERADRPELKKMLADAYAGKFDVIVAWREDRLYRGYRPMLDVLDCIEGTGIDIALVKEHFDKKLAPVKAWAARMELDAKQRPGFMEDCFNNISSGGSNNFKMMFGNIPEIVVMRFVYLDFFVVDVFAVNVDFSSCSASLNQLV